MTMSDEEWFAEQERLRRAEARVGRRCPLALFLGLVALVLALWGAFGAVWTATLNDVYQTENSVGPPLAMVAAGGLLGAYSVWLAARAYDSRGWARKLCGFSGAVAAVGVAGFQVLWAVYV